MKLPGHKIHIDYTPLQVSGNIVVEGGATVQFYDGTNYYPNRSGTPSSPILLSHEVDINDPDEMLTSFEKTTKYYENDIPITASTNGYTLIGRYLRIEKNIPAGTSVVIKAKTEFLDKRTDKNYTRDDTVILRTILKAELQYQLELSQGGRVVFDGYRNPNQITTLETILKKGEDDVTDFAGMEFRWLNSDGKDVVENELYGVKYLNSKRTLEVDKTFINNELIKCEVWKGEKLIASDSVTFVRKFNSFRAEITIPELPINVNVNELNCTLKIYDHLGEVDVDKAFVTSWMLKEGVGERKIASKAIAKIPVSWINLRVSPLSIFPDAKRRKAWVAIADPQGRLIADAQGRVITIENHSI